MLKTVQLINRDTKPNGHSAMPEGLYESRFSITVDGVIQQTATDELLIDVINRSGIQIPHVCYHPQLGPIQTCDTCMVEIDGELVRACATRVSPGLSVNTNSTSASAAQREAFDR